MQATPTNKRRLIIITVIAIPSGIVICFVARTALVYYSAYHSANDAFLNSRADDSWIPGSYEFATMGIQYGMTESQVLDTITPPTTVRRFDHGSDWNGFAIQCTYEHGGRFKLPFDDPTPFSLEIVWIYFDPSGRAIKVSRDHMGRAMQEPSHQEFMLKRKPDTVHDK